MHKVEDISGTVFLVGAGPGDPELITIKGKKIIEQADCLVYASDLISPEVVSWAPAKALLVDSYTTSLEDTHTALHKTAASGGVAVKLHAGDGGLYGSMREQRIKFLSLGLKVKVIPGITAAFAAAAAAEVSFTLLKTVQSLVITRLHGRNPMPSGQSISSFAKHNCSMAVYLAGNDPKALVDELKSAGMKDDVTIVAVSYVGFPNERIIYSNLGNLVKDVNAYDLTSQTVFLVLPGQEDINQQLINN